MNTPAHLPRRRFLEKSLFASTAFAAPGLFAEQITTAQMTEGPFYPDKLPLDTDNDLLLVNDSITPAVGQITHVSGRVFSKSGEPIRNAFVEIWQVDNQGIYMHSREKKVANRDSNFQSYGRFLTDVKGRYYFRTIKPVAYSDGSVFRTPHIHIGVSAGGKRIFTSQILINGDKDNARDFLLNRIKDPAARKTLLVDFNPIPGSKLRELSAEFDIHMGYTVEELDDGSIQGLGKPQYGNSRRRG
jgi:protocatechuate 3,4-dioxygenase beta subunit